MASYFRLNDCEVVKDPQDAQCIVFVTCAFNQEREDYGIQKVQEFNQYHKDLIVVDCLPGVALARLKQSASGKFLTTRALNEIDHFFEDFKVKMSGVPDAHYCTKELPSPHPSRSISVAIRFRNFKNALRKKWNTFFDRSRKYNAPLRGGQDAIDKSYNCASLRISEGCLSNCSYCCIRDAIGPLKSKPLEICLKEYRALLAQGYREFTVTADNVGAYGLDIKSTFGELMNEMSRIDKGMKIRSYILELHPHWVIRYKSELLARIKNGKISHILCPVQSGSMRILKLMNRSEDIEQIKSVLLEFRKANPKVSLSSHFMIGFPSETEEDFLATLDFIKEIKISPIIIPYSNRNGTAASRLPNQIDAKTIAGRCRAVHELYGF